LYEEAHGIPCASCLKLFVGQRVGFNYNNVIWEFLKYPSLYAEQIKKLNQELNRILKKPKRTIRPRMDRRNNDAQ
jgi:hypothetical protein